MILTLAESVPFVLSIHEEFEMIAPCQTVKGTKGQTLLHVRTHVATNESVTERDAI